MPYHSVDTFYRLPQELVQQNPLFYLDYSIAEIKCILYNYRWYNIFYDIFYKYKYH